MHRVNDLMLTPLTQEDTFHSWRGSWLIDLIYIDLSLTSPGLNSIIVLRMEITSVQKRKIGDFSRWKYEGGTLPQLFQKIRLFDRTIEKEKMDSSHELSIVSYPVWEEIRKGPTAAWEKYVLQPWYTIISYYSIWTSTW